MKRKKTTSKIPLFLFSFVLIGIFLPVGFIFAEEESFYVDPSYDIEKRKKLEAVLVDRTDLVYFYIDKEWWEELSSNEKKKIKDNLKNLGKEFSDNIYPVLTSEYGSEWKPGIDNDDRITVLIHPMRGAATGYFNNGNEYSVYQNANSNEREMVYLDAYRITDSLIPSYLAHEMTHLITFNQKERLNNVQEEVWLNEARAEYAPTLCGYNDEHEGSYLRTRVSDFLESPSDSLTEWEGKVSDYGALSMFIHYLADHYGEKILIDSLKSSRVGIESLNEVLENNGFDERFSDIFLDWTIAVLVNDCSLDKKYCYLNESLDNLRIAPQSNFLPVYANYSNLSVYRNTEIWAGNWQKIFGGKGTLDFKFDGEDDGIFKVPYVVCSNEEECSVDFLTLNEKQEGQIILENFNKDYLSLTIIPSIHNKDNSKSDFSFSWSAETIVSDTEEKKQEEGEGDQREEKKGQEEKINRNKIESILMLLRQIKQRISEMLAGESSSEYSCQGFDANLYYGLRDNNKVKCLQHFLKDQGSDIYPEGLVTGNYLTLTKNAVIRFQEKYRERILGPLGLEKGTGYFGPKTREIVNNLLD